MTAQPKYRLIADSLLRDVLSGRYPVGSLLPTESELMGFYGVSRHTVRSAIQNLKSRSIVSSRQGKGSTVISDGSRLALVEQVQSIEELIEFAQENRRKILGSRVLTADQEMAERIGCGVGRRILEVNMLRSSTGPHARPLAHLTLWTDALFESALVDFERKDKAIAQIIEEWFGLRIGVVYQTVWAETLDAKSAALLGSNKGGAALVVERKYAESQDRPAHIVARSICAEGGLTLVSTFVARAKSSTQKT